MLIETDDSNNIINYTSHYSKHSNTELTKCFDEIKEKINKQVDIYTQYTLKKQIDEFNVIIKNIFQIITYFTLLVIMKK